MKSESFNRVLDKIAKGNSLQLCLSDFSIMQRKALILTALVATCPKRALLKLGCYILGCGVIFTLPTILILLSVYLIKSGGF